MLLSFSVDGDSDNPPDSCFQMRDGQPSSCTYSDGEWHTTWDDSGTGGGLEMGGFAVLFVLIVLAGIAGTVWKVSTARRMAREAGMNEDDAATMTLLTDDGFEATYLASNLRPAEPSRPVVAEESSAVRLRDLKELLDEGLITQAEYDERRRAIVDSL